jgi:hypothetical protein
VNAGLSYGALAFVAGGLLGPLREIVLAERIGGPAAAMAEAAMMALLLWLAARWVVGRLPVPSLRARTVVAGIGLAVVLACEVALGLLLDASGLTSGRASREVTAQLVGLVLLAWLVAMPFVVRRRAVAAP